MTERLASCNAEVSICSRSANHHLGCNSQLHRFHMVQCLHNGLITMTYVQSISNCTVYLCLQLCINMFFWFVVYTLIRPCPWVMGQRINGSPKMTHWVRSNMAKCKGKDWRLRLNKKHLKNVGPIRHCKPLHAACFTLPFTRCRYYRTPPLSQAACASMSTTTTMTTTTTRDRGDRYGAIEWAQRYTFNTGNSQVKTGSA